jgi:hypothetical protein
MCTVLLPPDVNPIAINKYIYLYLKSDIPKCFGMCEFWFKSDSILRFAGVSLIPPLLDTLGSFLYARPYINLATGSIVKHPTSSMILYLCMGCGVAGKNNRGPAVRKRVRGAHYIACVFVFLASVRRN